MVVAKRIPLREVAQTAGASISTVSRALNRTARVSPELERRIFEAAAALGMSSGRKDKAKVIAFVLSNRPMLHPFHSHVMFGAERYCAERNCHMLFFSLDYPRATPPGQLAVPSILERRDLVDGFILGGTNSRNLLELLSDTKRPFAVLGNTVVGDWNERDYSVVWVDDIGGAAEITRFLLGLKHEAVWFIGNCRLPWLARRFQGYRSVMEGAGLQPLWAEFDSEDEREIGYLGAKSILDGGRPATAMFAGTDSIAHGVYEALRDRGLQPGVDVSVAGFNDMPEATVLHPTVTTARVFPEQVGKRLVELVLRQLEGGETRHEQAVIPTRLIKRESCVAPSAVLATV
jgi:DNA-binding LacI/PurR family transcriptional regulator